MNFLHQGFQKLSCDRETERQTDTTEIIYHAASRVVNKRLKQHGRRSRGGDEGDKSPPPEFGVGEIVLRPDFVMLQNFKHQITCITM